ncbi:hypothetical protein [Labrys neptuniae]
MLAALDLKMNAQAAQIEEAKRAFLASGGDDNSHWCAAYAIFEKYQKQMLRMREYALRLAVAVVCEGGPA